MGLSASFLRERDRREKGRERGKSEKKEKREGGEEDLSQQTKT